MTCSLCREIGHNKRTCHKRTGSDNKTSLKQPRKISSRHRSPFKKTINLDKLSKGEDFYNEHMQHFKKKRPEQYTIATRILRMLEEGKNVSVKAEEKSGKREIMECIHCQLNCRVNCEQTGMVPVSIYVTALDRKDTKVQFEEQEKYGITSIVARCWGVLLEEIVKLIERDKNTTIYIHLDEDDYGTGDIQNLSKIFGHEQIKDEPRIKFIGYSATPEELEMSNGFHNGWVHVQFIPADSYFGAKKYLQKKLVRKPSKFFNGTDFTDHGTQIIKDMREKCLPSNDIRIKRRNIIVVRDTTPKNLSIIMSIKKELETKYNCDIHVYDQHTEMKWGELDSWKHLGKKYIEDEDGDLRDTLYKPVVIFISQTCTRSTEICPAGHRRLYAWHDAREMMGCKTSCYNTLSQAIGRVKHYTQGDHPENNILLYCDKSILEYTLNPESIDGKIKLSSRVKTIATKQPKKRVRYEDGFESASSVPDAEWQSGDPRGTGHAFRICDVDGKWCHSDKKVRYWNDLQPGGGGIGGRQQVIQYENETSDRYYIRTAIFENNEQYGQVSKMTFETTKQSMYK